MKKKTTYQTNIFLSREGRKLFFYLRRERMKIESERMNLYLTFYFFFKTQNKKCKSNK